MAFKDKLCCISVDEMSIKANLFYNISTDEVVGFYDDGYKKTLTRAKSVLVLMVRGISSPWKQPLAYFFVGTSCPAETLRNIIATAIIELRDCGLKVVSLTNDMGSNFVQLSSLLGISPEHPFFSIEGEDVCYMFDVPHLIKSFRNNLMKHSFHFDGNVASWNDILTVYHHDKNFNLRLLSKLTDSHVNPKSFQKMKVKLATQTVSETVASCIKTYVSLGKLEDEALGTAMLLSQMDKLFDILNSSKRMNAKHFNRAW
jgi:hypothetical protein